MHLSGGDVYTHSIGQGQLFNVQHDELWVYAVRCLRCYKKNTVVLASSKT